MLARHHSYKEDRSLILKELIIYLFIFNNSFLKIQFTYCNIHSFQVYSPLVFVCSQNYATTSPLISYPASKMINRFSPCSLFTGCISQTRAMIKRQINRVQPPILQLLGYFLKHQEWEKSCLAKLLKWKRRSPITRFSLGFPSCLMMAVPKALHLDSALWASRTSATECFKILISDKTYKCNNREVIKYLCPYKT